MPNHKPITENMDFLSCDWVIIVHTYIEYISTTFMVFIVNLIQLSFQIEVYFTILYILYFSQNEENVISFMLNFTKNFKRILIEL